MPLFFDTETTGFPNYRVPVDDETQPHLVQIAAILSDEQGREMASISMIVNPGVPIPSQASSVHGITNEVAERFGVPEKVAALAFAKLMDKADLIVAHNSPFDTQIMRTAFARSGGTFDDKFPWFCTMQAATPIVNLPPTEKMKAAGFNKPKPASLSECIRHFFDRDLIGAHDALVDVRACADVYWHLRGCKGVIGNGAAS